MNSKRPTRTKRSTSSRTDETPPKRRPRRVARQVEEPPAQPARKRPRKVKRPVDAPKPPDIARRSRASKARTSGRTIHLAMSPNAANILRAMLGRSRHDEPELEAIRQELEDQLI